MRSSIKVLALCAICLTAAACGSGPERENDAASVKFENLKDGDRVASPVNVCLAAEYIKIEPKGAVVAGSGHHHILINATPEELTALDKPGVLPADDRHVHLGDGSACKDIELTPGKHKLTAVIADGVHMTLDPAAMSSIDIEVTP